jgi:hypothetical protein
VGILENFIGVRMSYDPKRAKLSGKLHKYRQMKGESLMLSPEKSTA